jgi:Contractile injection system tube protein
MERVAFLLEHTGERLGCLLNPESLVVRRTAGVRPRSSATGSLSGAGLKDDPLVYTGGGVTELLLNLLFDVNLAGLPEPIEDVRSLTRPLFELAEGEAGTDGFTQPPIVRFVWGKQWNIPGVITAVAERLEQFTAEGAPQRSWLRMRLVRVSEPERSRSTLAVPPQTLPQGLDLSPDVLDVHEVIGGGPTGSTSQASEEEEGIHDGPSSERLDEIAWRRYGDCRLWRVIAAFNNIQNPLEIAAGVLLRIPPLSVLGHASTLESKS